MTSLAPKRGHAYPTLAVIAEGIPLPILLDEKLTRLELSEPERKHIRAAIDETIGAPAGEVVSPRFVREKRIRPLLPRNPVERPQWSHKWAFRLAVLIPPAEVGSIWRAIQQLY